MLFSPPAFNEWSERNAQNVLLEHSVADVKDKWSSRAARSRKTKRKIKRKQNQLEIKRCSFPYWL
jgi:hypothetical protein